MSLESPRDPPPGFEPFGRRGAYSRHNGPFWRRPGVSGAEHGFWALDRHCNGYGILHGGMIASFLDGLLGHAVGAEAKSPAVTVHLALDYLGMARSGEWIVGRAEVVRTTRELVFATGVARSGEREIARANAIFKLMRHRPQRG